MKMLRIMAFPDRLRRRFGMKDLPESVYYSALPQVRQHPVQRIRAEEHGRLGAR
jgi:hypothetical protein